MATKMITLQIPLDEDGALYKRLCAYCKAVGEEAEGDVESLASFVASVGIAHHMHNNLESMERSLRSRGVA